MSVSVSAAVEGKIDEAVVRRLILHAGGSIGTVHVKNGKAALQKQILGYNSAARFTPWMVLVDLDIDAACAPQLRNQLIPALSPNLCLCIAVRQVEAWLMADAQSLGQYLSLSPGMFPRKPEEVAYPKDKLVSMARRSRKKAIRLGMVPREGNGRQVGPRFPALMIEYVLGRWRPETAATRAPSLARAIQRLEMLVDTG